MSILTTRLSSILSSFFTYVSRSTLFHEYSNRSCHWCIPISYNDRSSSYYTPICAHCIMVWLIIVSFPAYCSLYLHHTHLSISIPYYPLLAHDPLSNAHPTHASFLPFIITPIVIIPLMFHHCMYINACCHFVIFCLCPFVRPSHIICCRSAAIQPFHSIPFHHIIAYSLIILTVPLLQSNAIHPFHYVTICYLICHSSIIIVIIHYLTTVITTYCMLW